MILEVEKSQASQILVTFQPERLQTEPQPASCRHPAVSSSGQQESWWGAAVSSGCHSSMTARTQTTHSFKQGTKAARIWPSHQMCETFELSFFKLTALPTKSICMIAWSKSINKSSPDFSSSHCSVHYSPRSRSEFFAHCTLWLISFSPTKGAAAKCCRVRLGGRAVAAPRWMRSRYTHIARSCISHRPAQKPHGLSALLQAAFLRIPF